MWCSILALETLKCELQIKESVMVEQWQTYCGFFERMSPQRYSNNYPVFLRVFKLGLGRLGPARLGPARLG